MKDLINYGIYFQNVLKNTPEKTIIVLGVARSGTSMVARVLDGLGVFIGDKKDQAVFEDIEISNALESNNLEAFTQLISKRNATHKIWGWKRPGSLNQIDTIIKHTRNPHFIIVYRDILSIALRNNISMDMEIHKSLKNALENYEKVNQFVSTTSAPLMLVSYEKALTKKRKFIKALSDFVGISANPELIKDCANLIEIDRKTYIENSTIFNIVARLEKTENGLLIKAGKPAKPTEEMKVQVNLNHEPLPISPITTNFAGTEISLPKERLVQGINVITATYDESEPFQNSPLAFIHQKPIQKNIFMFLHIPKTAGTSFRNNLEKHFEEKAFFPNKTDLKNYKGQYPSINDLLLLPVNRLNNLQFISGHYSRASTIKIPIPLKLITFFRKPEDRIISNLIHLKADDKKLRDLSLDEIFEQKQENLLNLQIKFILNNPATLPNLLKLTDVQFHEHMKVLLNQLHFFGIKERLQESLKLFENTCNLSIQIEKNANPKKLDLTPSEALLKKLNFLCAKENLLYNAANSIFETKLSKFHH